MNSDKIDGKVSRGIDMRRGKAVVASNEPESFGFHVLFGSWYLLSKFSLLGMERILVLCGDSKLSF